MAELATPAEVTLRVSLVASCEAWRSLVGGSAIIDPEPVAPLLTQPEHPLTSRERNVLALAAQGMPADAIARKLVASAGPVHNCLSRIIAKTSADGRSDAISWAGRH